MELFSAEFFLIFLVAVLILLIKARKNKVSTPVRGKQISFTGKRLTTYLSKETPLSCLLADGKSYGADFKDKNTPKLPHALNCRCLLDDILFRSQEFISPKKEKSKTQASDIGELGLTESRYYKYLLIIHHPEATDRIKENYIELMQGVSIDRDFRQKFENHVLANEESEKNPNP